MSIPTKPYEERTPDTQYRELIRTIRKHGIRSKTPQGVDTFSLIEPPPLRFDLNKNGFPIITERKIGFWRQPIGEICAFINGVRTIQELRDFGCTYWNQWDSPEVAASTGIAQGDLGPGSYGVAFHDFPIEDGGTFNQFEHLVQQIIDFPHLKTHRVTSWIPQHTATIKGKKRETFLAPCHGDISVRVLGDTLYVSMKQRSADILIGVPSNFVQYSAVALMLAHLTGYSNVIYIHGFFDVHLYENHFSYVDEILSREPRPFPTLSLTEEGRKISDISAFRREHFALSDYYPHPPIAGIPAAT